MKPEYEIVVCKSQAAWRQWLTDHATSTDGVRLRLYKKASGIESVMYAEAVDEALCFGWIDGKMNSYDAVSYIQRFTPRRQKSLWSKRNIEHVERLSKAGLMMPPGIAEVERAKRDGRWDAAYDKPSEMVMPASFLAELAKNPKAKAFYDTLNKSNVYAIAWQLQTAKTDVTRERRQAKILSLLVTGEKPNL